VALASVLLGKKAIQKAAEVMGDAAVDAVKAPRTRSRKRKKSGKRSKGISLWVFVLLGLALLFLLATHGHHLH